jgi:hypothetical protein
MPAGPADESVIGSPADGVNFAELINSTVYLGAYNHVSAMTATFTRKTASSWTQPAIKHEGSLRPVLWRVMGEDEADGSITLLSEYVLDSGQFHSNDAWLSFDYTKSAIRQWLNGSFLNNSFTGAENGALNTAVIVQKMWNPGAGEWVNGSFTTLWGSGPEHTTEFPKTAYDDKVYLPWREYQSDVFHWDAANKSAAEYIIAGEAAAIRLRNGETLTDSGDAIWALSRSPMPESSNHILPGNYTVSSFGLRPILKLNPANVLYAEKTAGNDKTRKFTLLNEGITISRLANNGAVLKSGDDITMKAGESLLLTGVAAKHSKFVYKIVKSRQGKRVIAAYGAGSADGVTINGELGPGKYTLYIWAQKDNTLNSHEGSLPMYFNLTII